LLRKVSLLRALRVKPSSGCAVAGSSPGLLQFKAHQEKIMAGYGGVDFIDSDSQLDDEEKLVRQTARQFGLPLVF
jgi:hypothetical protein